MSLLPTWRAATAVAGIAVGLAGALGSVRLVRSLLFGVAERDVTTLAGATLLLLIVAAVACVIRLHGLPASTRSTR